MVGILTGFDWLLWTINVGISHGFFLSWTIMIGIAQFFFLSWK